MRPRTRPQPRAGPSRKAVLIAKPRFLSEGSTQTQTLLRQTDLLESGSLSAPRFRPERPNVTKAPVKIREACRPLAHAPPVCILNARNLVAVWYRRNLSLRRGARGSASAAEPPGCSSTSLSLLDGAAAMLLLLAPERLRFGTRPDHVAGSGDSQAASFFLFSLFASPELLFWLACISAHSCLNIKILELRPAVRISGFASAKLDRRKR